MSRARDIANLQSSKITADFGIDIDNINIDGTEIDLSSGDLTIDVEGEIILDANLQGSGNGILLKDDGTLYGSIFRSSSHLHIKAEDADKDLKFMGNDSDGGGEITALTLDMSASGAATFNSGITVGGTLNLNSQQMTNGSTIGAAKGVFTSAAAGQLTLNSTSSDYMLEFQRSGTSEWWLKASSSVFQLHENGVGDHLTVKAGGNVGIGQSSSLSDAKVYISAVGSGDINVLRNQAVDGSDYHFLDVNVSPSENMVKFKSTGASNGGYTFSHASTEYMRIDSSGNVGIGTTSPTGKLDVEDTTGSLSSTKDVTAEFMRADGTYNPRLQIRHSTAGTDIHHTYSSSAADLTFSNGGVERMRIFSSGTIRNGVSGTAHGVIDISVGNSSASYIFDFIDEGGIRRMVIYPDGDIQNADNSYGAFSDEKLKENISDASSQWDDIKALKIRKYSLKSDKLSSANKLGVIAQELEALGMSGLVTESPDATNDNPDIDTTTKSVKYSILYMKAVKALQEAMTRIETLEAKIAKLEG